MEFLKTPTARIVVAILWGLGLACIFRQTCKGRNCIVFKAPDPNLIKNKIYSYNNKCYKYDTMGTSCTNNAIDI